MYLVLSSLSRDKMWEIVVQKRTVISFIICKDFVFLNLPCNDETTEKHQCERLRWCCFHLSCCLISNWCQQQPHLPLRWVPNCALSAVLQCNHLCQLYSAWTEIYEHLASIHAGSGSLSPSLMHCPLQMHCIFYLFHGKADAYPARAREGRVIVGCPCVQSVGFTHRG